MSMPPPGGSTRMTSAPSAASVAPPSGAAMKAESSTIRRPARIGLRGLGCIVERLGTLLGDAWRQRRVDVFEDRRRAGPGQLLDLLLCGVDLLSDLFQRLRLERVRPQACADGVAPHALDRIAFLRLVDLIGLPVFVRVVGRVVKAHAVSPALD